MSYTFNPHHHVKIWLSKKPDSFLNFENQKRLIKTRYKNPNDQINFVYAERLLSDKAKEELDQFCKEYNITPVSVEKDIIPECQTEREQELVKWYQHEIDTLDVGGNPASASDLLRWMGPVYRRGTYSDFDVEVSTTELEETVEVKESLLLNVGSMKVLSDHINLLSFNNDVIAVVDETAALEKIQKAQDGIINAYTNSKGGFTYTASTDALFNELTPILPGFFINLMEKLIDSLCNAAKELDNIQKSSMDNDLPWLTPAELRGQLSSEKENQPFVFAQRVQRALGYNADLLTEDNYIEQISKQYRQILAHKTNWLGWLMMPSDQYKDLRHRITLSDDELYKISEKETFRSMYIQSVLNSTGPSLLLLAMFDKAIHPQKAIEQDLAPYAFSQYGLGKNFELTNGEKIGATVFDGLARLFALEAPGEVGDISWVESGAQSQQLREEKIKEKLELLSKELPDSMATLLDEIAKHRDQIEKQLRGSFGFYRNAARQEKVAALTQILEHAKENTFSVADFYANLHTYRSSNIEAAFGQSTTKALIDRCETLCEQAVFCNMKTIEINSPDLTPELMV